MAPRVKAYSNRVQEQALPDFGGGYVPRQVYPDSFGSPVSKALLNHGRQIDRFGEGLIELGEGFRKRERREKSEAEKFDMSVVRMRENEDRTWAREFTTEQFETYKGEAAIKSSEDGLSVYERTKDAIAKRRQERLDSLENENQKQLFNVMFDGIEQRALADTSAYVRGANSQLEKQSYAASAESKYNEIIANRSNDERIAIDLDLAERDIRHFLEGSPEEFKVVKVQKYRDKVHAGVIKAFVEEKDPTEAWRYFNANKDDISDPVKIELKRILEKSSLEYLTRLKARDIQLDSKYPTIGNKLEAAKNLSSPYADDHELQERVREKLKAEYNDQMRIDAQQKRQEYESKIEKILNAKTHSEALEIARTGHGSEEVNLRKIALDMFSTGGIQTDSREYYRLRLMPHDQFIAYDMMNSRHLLSDKDFKKMVDLQAKEKSEKKPLKVRTYLQMANSALDSMGWFPIKKNEKRSKLREEFLSDYEDRLAEIFEKNKAEPTGAQAKEVINDLLLEFHDKNQNSLWSSIFGRDEFFKFQINTPEERQKDEYTPAVRPPELPADSRWSWKFDGWVFKKGGLNYVMKTNREFFLIPEEKWTGLLK